MLERKLIERNVLGEYFAAIEARLYRYPAIDPPTFAKAVAQIVGEIDEPSRRERRTP